MLPFLLAIVAFIVGANSSEAAERRSGALAGRLWRSGFTLRFFRLAGWGLERGARVAPSAPPTAEPSLPEGALARHPGLPALLEAAAARARALAERGAQIERVLAESGAGREGAPPVGGPTTRAELVSRRLSLVAELRASLDDARGRRADLVAAAENVRIQLARLRAGLAAPDDLDADLAELDAAVRGAPAPLERAPPESATLERATPV
jgi:hypothetical protein